MARQGKFFTLMTQKVTDGAGASGEGNGGIKTGGALYATVQVITESTGVAPALPANGVLKFVGSVSPTEPTWSSAASASNVYETKVIVNEGDLTPVIGSDGIVLTGAANIIKEYKVNVDNMEWFNVILSSWVSGKFTVKVKIGNDSRFK